MYKNEERSQSAVSLLSKRKKLERCMSSIHDSKSFIKELTNNIDNPSSFRISILNQQNVNFNKNNEKLDSILTVQPIFFSRSNSSTSTNTNLNIAQRQVELEEQLEQLRAELNSSQRPSSLTIIKSPPPSTDLYLKLLDQNDETNNLELERIQKLDTESKQQATEEFLKIQQLEELNKRRAEQQRKQIEQARKKQKEEKIKLKELKEQEKRLEEEQAKQKAIQEATRLRILEEQAKYEAKREERRNELKEARRKEKQFEQMLQQEAERIRDEELKRIENEQKLVLQKNLNSKIITKLEIVIDKELIRQELESIWQTEKQKHEEKARRVAEEKVKRDLQMHTKLVDYNIEYLKDRQAIHERRLLEEIEKQEAMENARRRAKERATIRAELKARKQAELEADKMAQEKMKLRAEEELREKKIIEEKVMAKLHRDKLLIINHRFNKKEIYQEAQMKAIEQFEQNKSDSNLWRQKAIKTCKRSLKNNNKLKKNNSLKFTTNDEQKLKETNKTSLTRSKSSNNSDDNKRLKEALIYLNDYLENNKNNNKVNSSLNNNDSKDFLKERRELNEKKLIKQKEKLTELEEAKKRAEIRAHKRTITKVRQYAENGQNLFDHYDISDLNDKFYNLNNI